MFIRNSVKLNLLIILIIFSINSIAQTKDTIEIQRNKVTGKVIFARFSNKNNNKFKIESGIPLLKSILRAKTDDDLRLLTNYTDEIGHKHQKLQQYYKGIKVEGAEYLLHSNSGFIHTINGSFADINLPNILPKIDSTVALLNGLKDISAKNLELQNNLNSLHPKASLIICKEPSKELWHLAWKFTIIMPNPVIAENIYVDAMTGKVINRITLIQDGNAPGTAATKYSSTQSITGDAFAGGYRLREIQNNVNIQTFNFLHNASPLNTSAALDFVDNDNNWTAAEWDNSNKDNAALDAHWGAEKVFNYWQTVHNRNSIDGNGLAIKSYVHFGSGYDNAYWYSQTLSMYYGDGSVLFRPLTSLDVCAHEFGHGICQFTANLVYQSESGALNEGFSDIWGASVEYWAAPNKQTWLIGEEITLQASALRSLSNPKQFGQPDTYLGTNWANTANPSQSNDYGGVHTNSGVLNHWYYFVSQGGSGINDINNPFTVGGIGINDAQKIAYRAESLYLNSSATYIDARNTTIQAARDLFGTGSCQEISATNAWFAVGVGAAYTGNNTFTITSNNNNNAICGTSSATYTVNVTAGTPVTWSVYPTGIVNISTASNTATLTRVADGRVALTASVTGGGCNGQSVTKQIGVGIPDISLRFPRQNPRVTGQPINYTSYNSVTQYVIQTNPKPGSYQSWSVTTDDPGLQWGYTTANNTVGFIFSGVNYKATFYGTETNACGSDYGYIYCQSVASGGAGGGTPLLTAPDLFTISPNPTTGIMNVQTVDNNTFFTTIRILDKMGNPLKQFSYPGNTNSITLNISDLPADTYAISVLIGTTWSSKLFIKG